MTRNDVDEIKASSRSVAKALGLKKYFTGRPCKNGHIAERLVAGACVVCKINDSKNAVAKKNRKARYYKNLEANREAARRWARDNQQRVLENVRRWRSEDGAAKQAGYLRKWRSKNPSIVSEQSRRYRKKYPEKQRLLNANRRARKRAAAGSYTNRDVADILKLQRGRCAYCPTKLTKFHVDHIVPLIKGGSNYRRNLQLLCQPCNNKKYTHDPIDYARSLGRLL